MKRAYSRCNSGHYFSGPRCPLDGWSSDASRELAAACERLASGGRPVSMAALRQEGVSECSLQRIIVIEFGSESSVFDAISPEGYVLDGRWQPIEEVSEELL
jgi:hypothetical protein